jgi:hypothetical protein
MSGGSRGISLVLHLPWVSVAEAKRDLFFCNLNKKDFDPTNRPTLELEYTACGLKYLATFHVPALCTRGPASATTG